MSKNHMSVEEDINCIAETLSGNIDAYSRLIDKYRDASFSLAFKITRNHMDAEEVAHDSFIKALQNLKKFKGKASFSTWLYRIVYNTSITRVNKRRPPTVDLENIEGNREINTDDNAYEAMVRDEQIESLLLARKELKSDENVLIDLYYYHDKNMKEIAEITGETHGNIRIKLMRLRKKMLKILGKQMNEELNSLKR